MTVTPRCGLAILAAVAICALAACTPNAMPGPQPGAPIHVLAAENVWGSLATQLGGDKVQVTSVISNPNSDPHDYEPTVADARALASASEVVYNGAGYDPWVAKLLGANPNPARLELDVGRLVGAPSGVNPHFWYSPQDVRAVIARVTADYQRLDPTDAAYFDQRRKQVETESLTRNDALASAIVSRYAGTPIGASESIVVPLAEALRLKLLTPATFLNAVSEGVDPSASDKAVVDAQIRTRQIKIFIYNRQNSTPDVMTLVAEAKAAGIPVVTITETLQPPGATFQDWQANQLVDIANALKDATGK
jgi:zinc/manganese transport system substrate-binding protein